VASPASASTQHQLYMPASDSQHTHILSLSCPSLLPLPHSGRLGRAPLRASRRRRRRCGPQARQPDAAAARRGAVAAAAHVRRARRRPRHGWPPSVAAAQIRRRGADPAVWRIGGANPAAQWCGWALVTSVPAQKLRHERAPVASFPARQLPTAGADAGRG
jgi:hypothetical protein